MHKPSTRLWSRWYCAGSAGVARLTDSAILSAFQYEPKATTAPNTRAMTANSGPLPKISPMIVPTMTTIDHERDDEQDAAALVRADQFEHRGEPGRPGQNSTVGATRAASSASKYSRASKFIILAMNTVGHLLDLVVVVEHAVVVELAGVGDATFGGGQFLLQRQEVLVGLEVGVRLAEREHLAERAGEHVVGLGLCLGGVGRGDRRVAGLDHGFEGAALVGGVALDGLDEVRDEVESALELDVDLRPGVVDLVAAADQAVVHRRSSTRHDHQHDDDHDDGGDHRPTAYEPTAMVSR